MKRYITTFILVAFASLNLTASARARVEPTSAATLAAVQEWVGPYSFTYTQQERDSNGRLWGTETETESGEATFTFFAPSPPGAEYRGTTTQELSSFKGTIVSPRCGSRREWAHGTATQATELYISRSSYEWHLMGYRVRQAGNRDRCGTKPAKHRSIGGFAEARFVPLPSSLELCGTVDVRTGGRTGGSRQLTGSWAFFPEGRLPKGELLRHLSNGCAHIVQGRSNYYGL